MNFSKIHGCGNDYVFVNAFQTTPENLPELAQKVANRHFGIGSDGLILAMPSTVADVRMRMFNADGSEGVMCGNGIRGLAKFVYDHQICRTTPLAVETLRGVLSVEPEIAGGKVVGATVDMDRPIFSLPDIGVDESQIEPGERGSNHSLLVQPFNRYVFPEFVSMGSGHMILFVTDLAETDLQLWGPPLANHRAFPNGINIHFAQILAPDRVRAKTWERGSGPTMACGTGACAIAVAGQKLGRLEREVTVEMPGGELRIAYRAKDDHVLLTGPVAEAFSGVWPG